MPNSTNFPIFGTGGVFKVASGTGIPSDPYVPAVTVASNLSGAAVVIVHQAGTSTSYPAASNTDAAAGTAVVAAVAAAVSGDTIYVYRSAAVTSNLAKDGVNWWIAPGVTITSSIASVFHDGGAAMSFTVGGDGILVSTGGTGLPVVGVVQTSNAGSNVSVTCRSITATLQSPSKACAVNGKAGTLTVNCSEQIYGGLGAIYWADGDMVVNCPRIVSPSVYPAISSDPVSTPVGDLYVNADRILSSGALIAVSTSGSVSGSYGRLWITANKLEGSGAGSGQPNIYASGTGILLYITCQKISETAPRAGQPTVQVDTGAQLWLNCQKFTPNTDIGGGLPAIYITASGASAWLNIGDVDDSLGAVSDDQFLLCDDSTSTVYFTGQSLALVNASDGITVSAGVVNVSGLKISTHSGSHDLVQSGGTLNVAADVAYTGAKTTGTITYLAPFGSTTITTSTITTVGNVVTALNSLLTALGFSHN